MKVRLLQVHHFMVAKTFLEKKLKNLSEVVHSNSPEKEKVVVTFLSVSRVLDHLTKYTAVAIH